VDGQLEHTRREVVDQAHHPRRARHRRVVGGGAHREERGVTKRGGARRGIVAELGAGPAAALGDRHLVGVARAQHREVVERMPELHRPARARAQVLGHRDERAAGVAHERAHRPDTQPEIVEAVAGDRVDQRDERVGRRRVRLAHRRGSEVDLVQRISRRHPAPWCRCGT
jgi:hypothetical protein